MELSVPPENFNVSVKELEDLFAFGGDLPPMQGLEHYESAPHHQALAAFRAVVEAQLTPQFVPVRFIAQGTKRSATLALPLKMDLTPEGGFSLRTPDEVQSVKVVLVGHPDGRASLSINVQYQGLPVHEALYYAHFLRALYREKGLLYLAGPGPEEDRIELFDLPLPVSPSDRGEIEDRLRFLEVLDEIGRATGTEFVYPSEVDDDDRTNLNRVLKVIRSGWVALPVTDFTTPMDAEGVRNALDMVVKEGEEFQALALTASWERVEIFGSWVELGPSVRYVASAQLVTPRAEMEEWLASGPEGGTSFALRWVPADDTWVHAFYQEWPKPSLGAVREDIRAFEEEYGRDSDEFRRAWESGEEWAREVEGADVWMTLLDAERHLGGRGT